MDLSGINPRHKMSGRRLQTIIREARRRRVVDTVTTTGCDHLSEEDCKTGGIQDIQDKCCWVNSRCVDADSARALIRANPTMCSQLNQHFCSNSADLCKWDPLVRPPACTSVRKKEMKSTRFASRLRAAVSQRAPHLIQWMDGNVPGYGVLVYVYKMNTESQLIGVPLPDTTRYVLLVRVVILGDVYHVWEGHEYLGPKNERELNAWWGTPTYARLDANISMRVEGLSDVSHLPSSVRWANR